MIADKKIIGLGKELKGYVAALCPCGNTLYLKKEHAVSGLNSIECPNCHYIVGLVIRGATHENF